jgi:hypothetical protein
MAWVYEGNRRNYYRSRRVGGKVRSEYFGSGAAAELAAALDRERRRQRQAERERRRADEERWAASDSPLEMLVAATDMVVEAALLAAGYHRHAMGDWRKRRGHGD